MAKTPQLHCGNIGSIPIGVNINIFNISNDNRQYNFFDNTLSTLKNLKTRGGRYAAHRATALRAENNNKSECRFVISQWV